MSRILPRCAVSARLWLAALAFIPICLLAGSPLGADADFPANGVAGPDGTRQNRPGAGLPMSFEANQGQFFDDIKFRSRGAGYSVVLRPNEAVLLLGDTKVQQRRELPRQRSGPSNRGRRQEPRVQMSVSAVVRLSMVGANTEAEVSGESQLPGTANYFLGNDPAFWRTAVPIFEKVRYHRVYPGIDLVYYGNQRQLEYDFVVTPGAQPDDIRLRLEGVDRVSVESGGDLMAHIGPRHLRWQKPRAYQVEGGNERPVVAEFVVEAENQVSFRLGPYDTARPLVIDPLLVYSSYLGGNDYDSIAATAVDNLGNVCLAGTTYSTNFPLFRAFQTTRPTFLTNSQSFVTKLNSNGSALVFSTYFGGSSVDGANGIAVDSSGNIYVVGGTESENFPTRNEFQSAKGNFTDAFLSKFGPFGTNLLYSTYYGDSGTPSSGFGDEAFGVAVDNSGGAYIVGDTESGSAFFSKSPLQNGFGGGATDVLLARFDTTKNGSSSLVWGSWYGASFDEYGYAIALDASGNVYVTGYMEMVYCYDPQTFLPCPPDFPTVNAFQPAFGGDPLEFSADAFVIKIDNSTSPSRVFSTYLGGFDDDLGYGIAVDSANNVYVVGETSSTDFPVLNARQPTQADGGFYSDAFVAKFSSSGTSLLYSTYLGGTRLDGARSIVLDRFRNVYVVGYTTSTDFPVTPGAPQTARGGTILNQDLFVAKLNPTVPGPSSLVLGTYFGGSADEAITAGGYFPSYPGIGLAVDTNLNMYFGSDTQSTDLPATAGVFQLNSGGAGDSFVAKIASPPDISVALVASSGLVAVGGNVLYTIYANNNGPTTINNVTVVDVLPANLQYVSGNNNAGTINNSSGTVTCSFGTMTNGAAGIATITATAVQPGTVTDTATISAAPADVNTNNNVSSAVTVIRGVANVGLTMTDTPDPVNFSSNVSYTITVSNSGPWPATSLIVSNPIPSGSKYVLAGTTGGYVRFTNANGEVNWFLSDLPSGGSTNLTLGLQATAPGTLTNRAVVSFFEFDPVTANNSVTMLTTVRQMADLSVASITDAPDPVFASSNLTYTISVTNPGPTAANSVQVMDALPAGFTFVTATPSGSYSNGVVTCNLGNMAIGATATATITAKPPLDGLVTNSATVSSTAVDPFADNNSAPVVTTVTPLANLAVGISVLPTTVVATSNLVYTIAVTNFGPTSAYGVVVTSPLPAGLAYVSAQSSQGSCTQAGGLVNCDLGTITNSGTATVTITAMAVNAGLVSSSASVGAATTDPVAGNNSATTQATVTQLADLSIFSISDAPDPVFASSNLTYTVIVTNPGPTVASSVQVIDALPAGFTFVTATPSGTYSNGVVTCNLGTMPTGTVATATITARPPLDGLVTNSVTVSTSALDPASANNTAATDTTVLPLANLAIGVTALTNNVVVTSNLVYTISVTNRGPTSSSGVVVTNLLPASLVFLNAQSSQGVCTQAAGMVTCNLGTMTSNGTATVTITAATTTTGVVTNSAGVAAATTDPVSGNNSATAQATVTQLADLSIFSISDAPDPVFASSNLTYTIIVTNAGPTAADSVQVVETLPAGFTFVSATPSGNFNPSNRVVTSTLGTLAIGATGAATITIKPPLDGLVTNSATVGTAAFDPLAANNSAAVVTTVNPLAELTIGMTVAPTSVRALSNLVYTISVTNRGPTSSSGVVVTNLLPASLVFLNAQSSQGVCTQAAGMVTCELGTMMNNGTATVTITAQTTLEGLITNAASVAAATTDPVSGNNSATAQATVTQLADLSIAISAATNQVFASSNLTYTITVTNLGPAAANAVQVTNVLPAGFTFISATPANAIFSQGAVRCNFGTLPIGATTNATVTIRPSLIGLVTNSATVGTAAFDPLAANNTAAVVTTVNPLAELTIGMTVAPTSVRVLSNVVYTISVTNRGPTSSFNVTVTNPLPASMAFVSAVSGQGTCTQAAGIVTCNLGTLTSNGRVVVTITAAPTIEGPKSNTASVGAATTDPVPTNNSATAVISVTNNPNIPTGLILRIAGSGTNVLLFWTTNSAGFVLQSSTSLINSNLWQSVTNIPSVVGGQYYVTNAIEAPPRYYRLSKPLLPPTSDIPVLRIAPNGTNVLLFWTTNSADFVLQSSPSLDNSNLWQSVTNIPSVVGDQYYVTNAIGPSPMFYRLFKLLPPPTLAVAISGTNVAVSWPADYAAFLLQRNDSLIQSNTWTTLSNITNIQAGRLIYQEPATNLATFYRLVRFP